MPLIVSSKVQSAHWERVVSALQFFYQAQVEHRIFKNRLERSPFECVKNVKTQNLTNNNFIDAKTHGKIYALIIKYRSKIVIENV